MTQRYKKLREAWLYSLVVSMAFLLLGVLNRYVRQPPIGDTTAQVLGMGFSIALFMTILYGIAFLGSVISEGDTERVVTTDG